MTLLTTLIWSLLQITTYDEYLESDEMARKRQGFAEAASDDED